jgi:hypothetical protein
MRLVLLVVAIFSALGTSFFAQAPRAAATTCTLAEHHYGQAAFDYGLKQATLVIAGEVIRSTSDPREYWALSATDQPRLTATVRVDATLKGEAPGEELTFENRMVGCGDLGPPLEVGEYVLLSLVWSPTRIKEGQWFDYRWLMTIFGSKAVLTDSEALLDEHVSEPRFSSLGDTDALIRTLAERFEIQPETIDAVLAAQARSSGDENPWRLVGALTVTFLALFLGGIRMRTLRDRASTP